MGFDDGKIILDSETGSYYAGQTVYGRIVFDQGKPKTIHGIYVSFKGYCKVHWTTTESRRENDRTVHHTINHDSYEDYFKHKVYVFGDASGEHHLQPGHHEFRFDYPIPNNCPSSFEGTHGHIRYRVKVVMVTSGMLSMNKDKKAALTVHAPLDLNANPYCREPIEYELINSYCCWCMNSGTSEIRVKLPVGGYVPGQKIPLDVSVLNHSGVDIDELKFAIKKDVTFEAVSRAGTKNEHDTVAEITKGPIPAGTTRNWNIEMDVALIEVYNLNACRYINIDYSFKVSTSVSGCHEDGEETHRIVFGTIPLTAYQDVVQIPLHNTAQNTAYPSQAITNQPLSNYPPANGHYPQNSPYPPGPYPGPPNASPYPGPTVAPYPGSANVAPYPASPNVAPYPGSPNVAPYPGTPNVAPYPGSPNVAPYPASPNVAPYPNPVNNSPYPPTNPPYPTSTPFTPGNVPQSSPGYPNASPVPPYPGATASPYPAGNTASPYAGGNLPPPYPGGNAPSPYPTGEKGALSPYPGGNSLPPYPGNSPNVTSTSLLKTGNIGFGEPMHRDPSKVPLLPPTANVANPTSPVPNPFASASAPVPSTPSEDNSTPDYALSSPGYNPDFVKSEKKDEKTENVN